MMRRILSAILLLNFLWITSALAFTNWCSSANTAGAYKFEETSGSIIDCSTHGNNGSISNGSGVTQGVTGKYGNALRGTAANNEHAQFNNSAFDNLASISVAVWAYNRTYGSDDGFLSDKASIVNKSYRAWALNFKTTNQLRWSVHYSGGTAQWDTSNGSTVTSAWQHYAVTHVRNVNGKPIIYINGVSQTLPHGNDGDSTIDNDSGLDVTILQNSLDLGEIDSDLDDLIVYSGILTSTDVNELMDHSVDGSQGASSTYSSRGIGRGIGRGILR